MVFGLTPNVLGQVTIGIGEPTEPYATLQIKDLEKSSTFSGDINAKKGGFMLPRVKLENKYQLLPFYTGDTTNVDYKASKIDHKGLYVYNIEENTDEELCEGLNQWNGIEWQCFQYALGKASVEILCPEVFVMGAYVKETPLTSDNKIKLVVNVTKPGAWTSSASIKNGTPNGYSFYATGVFLEKGLYVIYLDGQGTPIEAQTDSFEIEMNGSTCTTTINVQSNVAEYDLLCSSTTVNGSYLKGKELDASNTITLRVNVSKIGSYRVETEESKGIKFSAMGDFTSLGVNTITLHGQGNPTVNSDIPLTITANTVSGNATCSVIVPVTLPRMTFAIIGSGGYSWEAPLRLAALQNASKSFGPDGIVRIKEFANLWRTTSVLDATRYLNEGYNREFPDIVLYFAFGAAPNAALSNALADYVNRGGAVIYGSSDATSSQVNILMNGIFGMTPAQAQISGSLSNADGYQVNNYTDNPVINGPFGNTAGLYWVEDSASSGSVVMSSLPDGSVQICPASNTWSKNQQSPTVSIVWMNDAKNFIYFGDSVATSSAPTNATIWHPARYTTDGVPIYVIQQYGQQGGTVAPWGTNANSFLEMNAVAYLIKKVATEGGINPH